MTGFEPAASCSQSRRATNCATPGYFVILFGWSYSPKAGALPTALHPGFKMLTAKIVPAHGEALARLYLKQMLCQAAAKTTFSKKDGEGM